MVELLLKQNFFRVYNEHRVQVKPFNLSKRGYRKFLSCPCEVLWNDVYWKFRRSKLSKHFSDCWLSQLLPLVGESIVSLQEDILVCWKISTIAVTRQVSSTIPLARPTIPPVLITILVWKMFLRDFWKWGPTDGRTYYIWLWLWVVRVDQFCGPLWLPL